MAKGKAPKYTKSMVQGMLRGAKKLAANRTFDAQKGVQFWEKKLKEIEGKTSHRGETRRRVPKGKRK
jgi:hypothetical protein